MRKIAEKMITLGKRGDLHARRQALQVIRDRKVVGKLFEMVAPRYKERPGGYTRILKLGNRQGDNAPMCQIELVEEELVLRSKKAAAADTVVKESPVAEVVEQVGDAEVDTVSATDDQE